MTNRPAGITAVDYDKYVDHFTKPWNDYLIECIKNEAETLEIPLEKILDVGTGTARTLIDLVGTNSFPAVKMIGIDYFQEMIDTAKNILASLGLSERVEVRQADVHYLPFEDNSIDLIFGRSVVHHWDNPVKAYQEIYRVLTPGGVCIIHEPSREPTTVALDIFNEMRIKFGIEQMSLSEKFTRDEVLQQLHYACLADTSSVSVGEGLAGLGFEIRITKKQNIS